MATVRYATPEGTQDGVRRMSGRSITSRNVTETKTYKRRWLMLSIFVLCTIANAIHWLQYSIISSAVIKFYGVSTILIDITGLMFSLTFIAFVFPAMWMIERYGLKLMLILGDSLMIVGSCMKLVSIKPQFFYVGFAGQVLIGVSQVFIINVTSYLAGVWFPSDEVSTACAIGVLGTQIGVAFGFFIPPQVVHDINSPDQLQMEFFWLYTAYAVLPTIALPLLVFIFKNVPPIPPSLAHADPSKAKESLFPIFKDLMRNKNYDLMVISYSLSVATFYCVSVMLDQIVAKHYSEDHELAGISGTVLIVCGVFGCLGSGWFMDKTHKFKLMAIVMYVLSLVGLCAFWVSLFLKMYYLVLISVTIMGFFMVSYVIVAIEFSSEVTYPISETISTSVLLMFGELASVILIYMSAELMENFGDYSLVYTTGGFLVVGMIVTCCFTNIHLKRHQASVGGLHLHHRHDSPSHPDPVVRTPA